MKNIPQNHSDAGYRRRANTILLLYEDYNVTQVTELLKASCASVRAGVDVMLCFGEAGLAPDSRGRSAETFTEVLCAKLLELVQEQPDGYNYLRGRQTEVDLISVFVDMVRTGWATAFA